MANKGKVKDKPEVKRLARIKFCSSCEHALIGIIPRGHGMPDEDVLFCTYYPPKEGRHGITQPELYCSKYEEAK